MKSELELAARETQPSLCYLFCQQLAAQLFLSLNHVKPQTERKCKSDGLDIHVDLSFVSSVLISINV